MRNLQEQLPPTDSANANNPTASKGLVGLAR